MLRFNVKNFSKEQRVIRKSESSTKKVEQTQVIRNKSSGTKSWGTPTWIFFHTIFANMSENIFQTHKEEILRFIGTLLELLPCPACASHATKYVKKNPLSKIVSVSGGEEYFFKFHNQVNSDLGKNKESPSILSSYKGRSMRNSYNEMIKKVFFPRAFTRNILLSHHRNSLYASFKSYLTKHPEIFSF